jgi:adenylate kinase family enzyme
MTKETTYKPNETYNILKSLVEANDTIMKAGGVPVSVSLVGTPGLGKTTICRELAADLNRDFFKLNLAQLTEPSELIGYYSKEYEVKKADDVKWVTENLLTKFTEDGFEYTGEVRTRPCPPDWVVSLKEGGILLLDDYSRSNTLFSQAVMELVNEQTMVGWDLKKKSIQIILTENPDNGEYNVASMDKAQQDRMMRINMVWDAKDWAERAEKIGVDERLINFVLWKPETFENKKQDGISASNQVTPRMMDKFFSLVSTIDDFEKNLDRIVLFGDISVGKSITGELINFINKKLDKLPSVEKLIKEYNLDTAKAQLTLCCGDFEKDANNWKGATSAILCTRLYNYMRHYSGKLTKDNVKQYLELILHGSFSVDQKFLMVRQTIGSNNNLTPILASDPRFIKYMTK